jgi:hypothetical protein
VNSYDRVLIGLLEIIKGMAQLEVPRSETDAGLWVAMARIQAIVEAALMEYRRDRLIRLGDVPGARLGDISDAEIVAATSGREEPPAKL